MAPILYVSTFFLFYCIESEALTISEVTALQILKLARDSTDLSLFWV